MSTPTGQKRQGRILLLILLIAILLDKLWVSRVLPQASGLVSINPMIVFLDIPLDLSLTFGLISVTGIFILLYVLLIMPYHSRRQDSPHSPATQEAAGTHSWRIITGVLVIPCWVLSGGFLYLAAEPHLPRQTRNAIESFGINADISTSFPGYELVHLRGSMVMFVCFFIGMHICLRKIRKAVPGFAPETASGPVPMTFPEAVRDPDRKAMSETLPQTAPGPERFAPQPGYPLGPANEPTQRRTVVLRQRPEFTAKAKPCYPAPSLRVRSYEEL